MKRMEMDEIIKQELEYIPKGSRGSIQNRLRFQYSALRRKGIAKGKSRQECLRETIDQLKEHHPGFQPEFDKGFFNVNMQQPQRRGFFRRLLRIGN
jgi:hypothetical protein